MVITDAEPAEGGGEGEGGGVRPSASQRLTPYLSKSAPRPHTPAAAGKFAERPNAGSTVASLNAHLEVPLAAAAPGGEAGEAMEVDGGGGAAAPEVAVLGQPMQRGATYMVDRLEERVRGG